MKFSSKYFYLFSLVFLTELMIALYVHDSIIRPFVGDILVVVLLYFFVLMLFRFTKNKVVLGVLLFAYLVELGQYFDLVTVLNLHNIKIARIVIGATFDVMDLIAYTLGAFLLLLSHRFSK